MRSILGAGWTAILLTALSSPVASQTSPTIDDLMANPTVKYFIAACSKVEHVKGQTDSDGYVNCTSMMMMAELKPDYCPPPKSTEPDDMRLAVIEWLKRRPDMSSMDRTAGILTALKALYCH